MRERLVTVLVLTAAAALAGAIAVALARGREHRANALPRPSATWYTARAAVRPPAAYGTHTACGRLIGPAAEGVAHPVLPCGMKLYVSLGAKTVLAQVIDRVPNVAPREFDVTTALAERLGLTGTAEIRWTYARRR